MATQLQFRRGTTVQHSAFTGGLAEVTVDTDKKVVVVHDGVTAGGWPAPSLSFTQAAFDQANAAGSSATVTAAYAKANTAANTAQAAFDVANTKYSSSGGTISGDIVVTGNVTPTTDNVYSLGSPGSVWKSLYVGPGSIHIDGIVLSNTGGSLTISGASDISIPSSGAPSTTIVSETANLSFDQANAAYATANAGYATANSGYNHANTANLTAQAAFDVANTKYNSSGGTISGSVTITQNLDVTGNLNVTGNVTTVDVNNITLANGMIYLADGNVANTMDIGLVGAFTEGIYQHTGLIRDNSDGVWKLFSNVVAEPTSTVDFTGAVYDYIKVGGVEIGNIELGSYSQSAFSQANSANTTAQAGFDVANTDVTSISISAGTYGNTTTIPSVTVEANGRVSAISVNAFTAGAALEDDTITSADYYPLFATATSGTPSTLKVSSTKLTFNPSTGTLTAVDLNTSSDINFKKNIQPIGSAINTIKELEGVSFNWKETGAKSYGVIAQQLQQVLPELVNQSEHGLSVSYLPIIAILIEAVKEQQKQIDELKKQ